LISDYSKPQAHRVAFFHHRLSCDKLRNQHRWTQILFFYMPYGFTFLFFVSCSIFLL